MQKLSIGTWAYLFHQEKPTYNFHDLLHKLSNLGYEGLELGAFDPHPGPDSFPTRASRQALRHEVEDHGLEISALVADWRSQKLWSVEDSGPFLEAFARNLTFADDLGIRTLRLDTVEPVTRVAEVGIEPQQLFDRVVRAFDQCAKWAADRGINLAWEFEPSLPLNKPSEVLDVVRVVRDELGNSNFGVLFDTGNAHLCAGLGVDSIGTRETLRGGALELLAKLSGKLTHVHLSDSDGTLSADNTRGYTPFGTGALDFDALVSVLNQAGVPHDWWCIDLGVCPQAWEATAESKFFLDRWRYK